MIFKSWSNTLMEQLFYRYNLQLFVLATAHVALPTRAALYLNDWELSIVKLALLAGTSSLLNYHKDANVSE